MIVTGTAIVLEIYDRRETRECQQTLVFRSMEWKEDVSLSVG